jgi:universal stress protein A
MVERIADLPQASQSPAVRPVAIQHILLPIAGGPSEQSAIDYAAVLAIALHASITLVHVNEVSNSMIAMVPGASIDGDLAAERGIWTEWLDKTGASLVERGIDVAKTRCFVATSAADALVELARRERFGLIVMATHARTGASRVLLGSVAEHVLRHAPCPVLTIHHPA